MRYTLTAERRQDSGCGDDKLVVVRFQSLLYAKVFPMANDIQSYKPIYATYTSD